MTDRISIDLARREDFRIGTTLVLPSTRQIRTSTGEAVLEPRVMQVLLAFHDSAGQVLTRNDLLQECWGGIIVGDDAINRAISEIRKAVRDTDADFTIETIARVGYRLSVAEPEGGTPDQQAALRSDLFTRRGLVTGGAALAVTAAAGWWAVTHGRSARLEAALEEGVAAYLLATPGTVTRAITIFERATRIDPRSSAAWGWLAIANLSFWDSPGGTMSSDRFDTALRSAERALRLDPQEPNGLTAMAILRFRADDWVPFEASLSEILRRHPENLAACTYLTSFLQAVGRCEESWDVNERGIGHQPFAPVLQLRRGLKHWIFGRTAQADRVLQRAAGLWPDHPLVWNAILTVLAYSDRAEAALRMLGEVSAKTRMPGDAIRLWRTGLRAMASGAREDIAAIKDLSAALPLGQSGLLANALMMLSSLGEVDAAYATAERLIFTYDEFGELLGRGSHAGSVYADAGWRQTQWLFTPATAPMRADARFSGFCERLGYREFWQKRDIWPDDFVRGSLVTE